MDHLIDQLRAEIERQHIALATLAADAEVGRPYLYRVLSGEQTPSLEWLAKVFSVLGLEICSKTRRVRASAK